LKINYRLPPYLSNLKPQNMKKIFAVLAIIGVMTSCKGKKDDKKVEDKTTTAPTNTDTTTAPVTDNAYVPPTFADPDVQKYVTEYSAFVTSYVDAFKAKDMDKVAKLGKESTMWTEKSQSIPAKLAANPDAAKRFTDFMIKMFDDMSAAMKSQSH
jgi:hypothetical protein